MRKMILGFVATLLLAGGFAVAGASPASAATPFCSDRAYLHFYTYGTGDDKYPFVCFDEQAYQINIWSQWGGYYGGMTPNPGFYSPWTGGAYTLPFHADQWTWYTSIATRLDKPGIGADMWTNNHQNNSGPMVVRVANPLLHDELEWFAGGNGFFTVGRY